MRRFTSTGLALLALLAISATVAGTASAAAPKLDLTWLEGTSDLEPGDEFKMVNYSGITLQTSSGSITCPGEQGFVGTVLANSEPTDTVDLRYSYGGIGGDSLCASTVPLYGEVTAVEVSGASLPLDLGVLSLSAKGKARLLPPPGVSPDALVITSYYPQHGVEYEECVYSFAKLNGTVTLEPEEFFELTRPVVNFMQKLKFDKVDSGALCPKKATLIAPSLYVTHNFEGTDWIVWGKLL